MEQIDDYLHHERGMFVFYFPKSNEFSGLGPALKSDEWKPRNAYDIYYQG